VSGSQANNIGVRVGKVINRFKMAKHLHTEITDNSFRYHRLTDKIASVAKLDGIYVIRTSVAASTLTPTEAVLAYKSLSQVEQAFRSCKTVDLHVRPIFHRLADRVKAHIFFGSPVPMVIKISNQRSKLVAVRESCRSLQSHKLAV
jgi:transposase